MRATRRLQLLGVLELDDEAASTRTVLSRLNELASASQVAVLVTNGLDPEGSQAAALDGGAAVH
jgi:hypothetical protein